MIKQRPPAFCSYLFAGRVKSSPVHIEPGRRHRAPSMTFNPWFTP
jgi:hypothetical protein